MTGREAFQILILGSLRPKGCWDSRLFRDQANFYFIHELARLPWLSAGELDAVTAARQYCRSLEPSFVDGCMAFPSVYDLLLFLERDCFMIDMDRSIVFRGQRDHAWSLLPSLAREPSRVSQEIAATAYWIEQLVEDYPLLTEYEALELIAIAQHYGCKTCFLDYTFDLHVAAAFACLGYKPSPTCKYGAIYNLNIRDVDILAPSLDLTTGGLIQLQLSNIPRIQRQRGVFYAAFNVKAFAGLAGCERYLFHHSDDSVRYPSDVGLSDLELLPSAICFSHSNGDSQKITRNTHQPLESIEKILWEWTTKCLSSIDWHDYYCLMLAYVGDEKKLNNSQLKRLRVFSRLFAELQRLNVFEHPPDIIRLHDSALQIKSYYQISDECESFLQQIGEQVAPSIFDEVELILERIRLEEGYDPEQDGPYFFG